MCRRYISLVFLGLLLGLACVSNAAVIGFQAESGTLGAHFDPPIIDANALGGQYITIETPAGGGSPGHEDRIATYTVTFPEAGTYDLYARLYIDTAIQGAADNDSMFYGNGFGTKPANSNADWIQINGCDNLTSDVWFWINLSEDTCQWGEAGVSFTVPAGGLTQTLQVGGREDGLRMDAFVFATSTLVLTDWELDAAVPQETKAFGADPADGSLISETSVVLSWQPGAYSTESHVYFSEVFDDVNDRTEQADKGLTTELTYAVSGLVPGTIYYWAIDEVSGSDIWPGDVWSFQIVSETAYNPDPYDGEISIDPEVVLAWSPGVSAVSHNVYLDKVKENVDARSGCLVNGVSTADPNYYPGPLEFNTTYYWAIDGVGGPPDNTIYTGAVWSFTTMPNIQISDPNLVGWWTFDEGAGSTALDWSGHGNHGAIQGNPVWVAGYDDYGSALDFDGLGDYVNCGNAEIFNITEQITVAAWMRVDVFEQTAQGIVSKGENAWRLTRSELTNEMEFDCGAVGQAVGSTNVNDDEWHHALGLYDGLRISLYVDGVVDGSQAATGLLTTDDITVFIADTNRPGSGPQAWNGLIDDVRIYNKALTQEEIEQVVIGDPKLAYRSVPANKATLDIEHFSAMSWAPGEDAAQHDVYFGNSADAVKDADTSNITGIYRGRQDPNTYTPPEAIEIGQTYYWRIDEIDAGGIIHRGRVWSFTVAEYLIVDDFEDYDDVNNIIYYTWEDYYANNTGMTVGYFDPPFAERSIIHGGSQAMYMHYDNDGTVNEGTNYEQSGTLLYSEAQRSWAVAQDWTRKNVTSLALWFRGVPASVGSFAPQGQAEGPPIIMTAGGADIWDTADQFHFAYKQLSGIGSITARVVSITDTDPWAKGGVMIRESLAPGAVNVAMVVTPDNGVNFQYRTEANAGSDQTTEAGITAPQWVRLTRTGNTFTGEYSANGSNWTTLGSIDIAMLPDTYIGLCLTSHNVDATCTAEFSNVTTDGTGQWQSQDIGIESNIGEPMYIVLEDSAGGSVVVKHPDPAATTIGTWTEWNIPLTEFTGVNLQAVTKMSIGVGDRANTQPGSAGDLYIDDIGLRIPSSSD